ncbi:MAG TPA: response regulator [Desulfuromonadales bacterium]|nr:response regulator [Desulfuromonadales bacterium]
MKRIVIADDSYTARMFIRRCLEIVGFQDAQFVEATNGKEALALIKEEPTDLLVTDLNMPVMDGETLLKWVKANPRLNELPVLVVTSAGNPAKEAELHKIGAFAILNKPINPPALSAALLPLQEKS